MSNKNTDTDGSCFKKAEDFFENMNKGRIRKYWDNSNIKKNLLITGIAGLAIASTYGLIKSPKEKNTTPQETKTINMSYIETIIDKEQSKDNQTKYTSTFILNQKNGMFIDKNNSFELKDGFEKYQLDGKVDYLLSNETPTLGEKIPTKYNELFNQGKEKIIKKYLNLFVNSVQENPSNLEIKNNTVSFYDETRNLTYVISENNKPENKTYCFMVKEGFKDKLRIYSQEPFTKISQKNKKIEEILKNSKKQKIISEINNFETMLNKAQ